jgi:quinoprotein glucose dehydrogenase
MVASKQTKEKMRTNLEAGSTLYTRFCMSCHGSERQGSGNYPAIVGMERKYNATQFNELLSTGKRMMPGFNNLSKAEKDALASFILNLKDEQKKEYKGRKQNEDGPPRSLYDFTGYNKFLTKDGYPAIKPPWGTGRRIEAFGFTNFVDAFVSSAVPDATHIINSRISVRETFIPAIAVADGYLSFVYLTNSCIASS